MESNYVKTASRRAARKAAQHAAADMELQMRELQMKRSGSVALYTWGSLAAVCALSFFVIKLSPEFSSISQDTLAGKGEMQPIQQIIVKNENKPKPKSIETVEDLSDEIEVEHPSVDDVAKIDTTAVDPISVGSINPTEALIVESNLGAVLGNDDSKDALEVRMKSLRKRAPHLFTKLTGAIQTEFGAEKSQLMAGPFRNEEHRAEFCRAIMLNFTLSCRVSDFKL